MKTELQTLPPPEERCLLSEFCSVKGVQFAEYLERTETDAFVTLRELRRRNETPVDIVVFDIEPERSQTLVHKIRASEPIAVAFGDQDTTHPEVLSLRSDFPLVPHINLRKEEFSRSLCMYDQS